MVFARKTLDDTDARKVVLQDGADVGNSLPGHRVEWADATVVAGDHQAVDGQGREGDECQFPAEGEEQPPQDDDRANVDDHAFDRIGYGIWSDSTSAVARDISSPVLRALKNRRDSRWR